VSRRFNTLLSAQNIPSSDETSATAPQKLLNTFSGSSNVKIPEEKDQKLSEKAGCSQGEPDQSKRQQKPTN